MEIGAFFILVLLIVIVAVLGGGVYLTAGWLRHRQLDPDKTVDASPSQEPSRPEHNEVESEQNARFIGSR
jgi:hypothetical protein